MVIKAAGSVATFIIMSFAWLVIESDGIADIADLCRNVLSNPVFYISHSAADELLNPKFLILPVFGVAVSWAAAYVLEKWDDKVNERLGHTFFKYLTVLGLLLAFAVGVILLLPQFPTLSSDIFGADLI